MTLVVLVLACWGTAYGLAGLLIVLSVACACIWRVTCLAWPRDIWEG